MNDVKLQSPEGKHPVDENLRPILVGGKSTAIETAQHGNGARVNGDLTVTCDITITGEITGKDDMVFEDVTLNSLTTNFIKSTDLLIDDTGDITLDAAGGDVNILQADVNIPATKKLSLDGGGLGSNTYIQEVSADTVVIKVGNDTILGLDENGVSGNSVSFKTSCAGFTRLEATFSATEVIGSIGTDDTDIDFRHSNKYRLEMTGDIANINLIFPSVSGNFLLVCTTDGDHDVTNWKAYKSDETAATTANVMWAGGSVPAFTSSGVDIVSFYWDATEEQAYGVASLAFATP